MTSLLKNIVRFTLFVLLQIFVLDKIPPLHRFISPTLYFLFILWLPFNINRLLLMIIAFAIGITIDYFNGTPGLHAAPCVLIAYIRPFLLNIIIPQETTEQSYLEPSIKSIGWVAYAIYIVLLTFIYNLFLVLIEWLQFGNFNYFIGKVSATSGISILLIFLTELLFFRKAQFKTNAG